MYRPETLNDYGLSHFDENTFSVSSPNQWCMVMNHLHGLGETTTMTLGGHSQALRFHAPLAFEALMLLVSAVKLEEAETPLAEIIEFDVEARQDASEADGE